MPKVPVLQKRVGELGLPEVSQQVTVPAGASGALDAEVIGQIGGQVSKFGGQLQQAEQRQSLADIQTAKDQAAFKLRRDKVWANDSIVKFQDWMRDKKPTYTNRLGLKADGVTNLANEDIETFRKSLLSKAENEEQRELINAKMAALRETALNSIKSHEVKEFRAAEVAATDATIENAIRDARDAHDDPLGLLGLRLTLDVAVIDKTKGMAPETAQNVKDEIFSAYHESVLNEKVVANAESAQEYYDEFKDEIIPENRDAIEKILETEDVLQTAQAVSDEIALTESDRSKWSEMARTHEYAGTDEEKALKRKETVDNIKVRKKELDQLDKESQQAVYQDTLNKIMNVAVNEEEGLGFAKRLENPEDRIKAEKVARERFERKTRDAETKIPVYATLLDDIAAGKYKAVSELTEFYPDLSTSHYNKAVSALESKLREDKTGKSAEGDSIKIKTAKEAYSLAVGEKYDVTNTDQNREFTYVYDKLVEMGITDFDTATKEIRNLVIEGDVRGIIWDETLTRQEAEAEGKIDKWLPNLLEIEDDNGVERRRIDNLLRSRGIRTTNETLMRLFKKDTTPGISLSDAEKAEYRRLINREGITRPVRRR